MKMVKNLVAASIAASLLATAAAQAATVSNPSTANPQVWGKTIVNESVRTVISPAATVVTLPAGEALSVDDSITFTLNNGTFAAVTNANLTTTGTGVFALVEGGVGSTFAKFRVTTATAAGGEAITLAAAATINGTTIANGSNIQVTTEMSGFVGGQATALFGSPLTSLNTRMQAMMTTAVTTASPTFDVATGYQQLLAGAANTTDGAAPFDDSATSAVAITTNAAAAAGSTTTGVPAAVPTAGSTLLTISGPMAGVDTITDTAAGGLITSSTSTGAAPTGGTVANAFWIDTANDKAYAIGAGAFGAPGVTDNLTVGMNWATNVGHDISSFELAVTRVADGSFSATTGGSGTLFNYGRNGSAFATNSFGPLNKITITDRSGNLGGSGSADGAVTITAFDTDGNAVTCTGLSISNIPANGTVTIQGADVIAACPGAKRIEGNVNSNSILVTNVKLTATGATAVPAFSTGGATAAQ